MFSPPTFIARPWQQEVFFSAERWLWWSIVFVQLAVHTWFATTTTTRGLPLLTLCLRTFPPFLRVIQGLEVCSACDCGCASRRPRRRREENCARARWMNLLIGINNFIVSCVYVNSEKCPDSDHRGTTGDHIVDINVRKIGLNRLISAV